LDKCDGGTASSDPLYPPAAADGRRRIGWWCCYSPAARHY